MELSPIGVVESPLTDPATAPKQGREGAPEAVLVIQPEVAEGLVQLAIQPRPESTFGVETKAIEAVWNLSRPLGEFMLRAEALSASESLHAGVHLMRGGQVERGSELAQA